MGCLTDIKQACNVEALNQPERSVPVELGFDEHDRNSIA